MSELIEPRLLKGFRDFLPAQEGARKRIQNLLEQTFASFGFEPIDTPVLEYTDILLGKGGGETDKQVYRFDDQGGRDVAMRYDLTVPFARFMAQHLNELYLPFKRFHIAKVFRGENTQRGRYREFVQCDFDIVGVDAASADFEIVLLMDRSFRAIGVDEVTIHLSHRGVFNKLLDSLGLSGNSVEVLRTVDKLRKIGQSGVREQLVSLCSAEQAEIVLSYITPGADNAATLASMRELAPGAAVALERLGAVLEAAQAVGIGNRLVLDPSITRGLDYYTGIVFETFLTRLPELGSVCSGGRYDNLAGLYSKEPLPGVGASIGLDRLMAGLDELGIATDSGSGADAVVICEDPSKTGQYHDLADRLRAYGVRADVYPENRKTVQQYSFAERKGIASAVFVPDDQPADAEIRVTVRDLSSRSNTENLSVEEAAALISRIVANPGGRGTADQGGQNNHGAAGAHSRSVQ